MTRDEQEQLKNLVKEGAIEALKSIEGQGAITDALKSPQGQDAITDALTTEKAKDIMLDVFTEGFKDVVLPSFERQHEKIANLQSRVDKLEKGRMLS